MAAHLSGYLVVSPGRDRAGSAAGAGRAEPRERRGTTLLVDHAADVRAATAIASAVEHRVGNDLRGVAHA